MALPASTYRLQVSPSFPLAAAADVCDYIADLGADAVYVSPILPSSAGSDHGYDVIGWDTVDPQRGGLDGWTRFVAAARSRGLKIVVDIVPNHTGVEIPADNAAWWDVLTLGAGSVYARWFDIEWSRGRVLLPVLGDEFEPSQLEVVDGELRYFEHRFPLAPATGPADGDTGADVHDRQHYELVNFRRADTDQNYRRFFAVTTLAGLRVEDAVVRDATHTQIGRWLAEDGIDGLRVDHPDGLADPVGYMTWLRGELGPDRWLVVEKILEHGEQLPPDWPVDGTTGYDALGEAGGVLLDGAAEQPLTNAYVELTGDSRTAAEHVRVGKRMVVDTILQAEIRRLARLVPSVQLAADAFAELIVAFPVYRSYLPDVGADHLEATVESVRATRPDLADTLDLLLPRLTEPSDELCVRFQQTTGAVMAKGVEDTAFYRYNRFTGLNEVGGDPGVFGLSMAEFHAALARRQADQPRSMTTLSTHDTKRSEDVRARLAVLTELPDEWVSLAQTLMTSAPLPDAPFAYLLWQTFVGVGFIERERTHAYAEKSMREAAVSTGWIDPNDAFEKAVHGAIDRAYDDPSLRLPIEAFVERITPFGWSNALSQKLIQLTMPGIPDVYQGNESWDDSLVDPDNRRLVDTASLRTRLAALDSGSGPPPVDSSGDAKLWLTSRVLRLRRERPDLFTSYTPVPASGSAADHIVAFDRGGVVTVATRLPVGLAELDGWADTTLDLTGSWTDVLTGRTFDGPATLSSLLDAFPVALLTR